MNKLIVFISFTLTLLLVVPCVALGTVLPTPTPLEHFVESLKWRWPFVLVGVSCGMIISAVFAATVYKQRPVLYCLLPFGLVLLGVAIFFGVAGQQYVGIGGYDNEPLDTPLERFMMILQGYSALVLSGAGCGIIISASFVATVYKQRPVLYFLLRLGIALLGVGIFCDLAM